MHREGAQSSTERKPVHNLNSYDVAEKENRKKEGAGDTAAPVGSSAKARFLDPDVLSRIGSLELLARTVVEASWRGCIVRRTRVFDGICGVPAVSAGRRFTLPDWRLYGRTDRYFIKKYRADTNTQCQIAVDTSASMRYGSGAVTKLQYAQFLAAAIAHLVARQQDSVGLLTFDSEVRTHVPAHSKTGHLRTILGHLSQIEAGGETQLAKMLHEAADRFTRRSVVVVVSDFYEDPEALGPAFQHLRFKGHDVIAFHVLDKNEIDFDFKDAILLLEDVETEEQMPVLPDVIADGYRTRMRDHLTSLREMASANRVDYELIRTDRALDYALFTFLARRSRY
ncbi:MAG: VWA domain-containing protein [Pyrinomonadaceae bacterium]